ncbi:MAG: flagellar M-ring protein FliF [Synergistaceae bacterium]|jgi:flagellar M-ring protein FliF|nr:flagellar M-ring protein FliF [Synergistaceae bacterium]
MREYAARVKEQLQTLWSSLSKWQRISMVAAALLVSGGILALAIVMGRTTYEPVFTGLEARDQNAIIEYLKEQKIPYRTDSSSNSILVPTANVHESRIALADKGIPNHGIVGFERFDNAKIGRTSFQEKVDYYRALEGELARTIREMNSVSSARVSIVVPESKLFLEQQRPSTAAVSLKLKPGAEFGQRQAKAVVHLVASSVEGLTPDNVTLVDADGQISFEDILDDTLTIQAGNQVVLKQRQFEKEYEVELERKLKDMLEKPYGPGRVKAVVRVELDFDKKQESRRNVFTLPEKNHGPIQSEQNTEESYTGPAGNTGGVPGTTTNIPGYLVNTGTGNENATYDRSDNVTNYDNSTHESSTVETQGKIKRLTATVLIDGTLEQPEIDNWRGAVATAIGADDERGDRISIMAMPFDTSIADAYAARLAAERRQRMAVGISSLFVLLAAAVLLAVMWLRKRKSMAVLRGAQRTEDAVPSLRELLENPDLMTAQGELSVLEEQLRNYAMNNPEELANLIKNWVVEDV